MPEWIIVAHPSYYRQHAAIVTLFAILSWPATWPALAATVTVELAGGPVNTMIPAQALGAGVDGHSHGDGDAIYRPATLRAMRSAGLRPLSYRLRTELGIEAWHWNPRGRWSDGRRAQGYWTSDNRLGAPILASYGYHLPRRGNTIDQAENSGYSRLADGDLDTFWKSNPYLDRRYTGEDNSRHPQWLIANLGERTPVNAIRIAWGVPYAVHYTVQYWDGEDPRDPDEYPDGRWETFSEGVVTQGSGGDVTLRLAEESVSVRFLRVLMEEASGTAPPGATDPRDALGYAVREVYIGTLDSTGRLWDAVRHAVTRDDQTRFFVSSTDPWHRASDLDQQVEQPGVDRVFASGLTRGLPMLIPVGVLYDSPDNAAALLRYLRRRGYPVRGIEIGEEPDGQYAAPEDYGALFLSDDRRRILARTATYHGAELLTHQWVGNPNQPHRVYPARVDIGAVDGALLLSAYAVQRPDRLWSLLLVNKDPERDWTLRIRFAGAANGGEEFLRGPADLYQFSSAQYLWWANGGKGRPLRSRPPVHTVLPGLDTITVRLPAWSLSVIRGQGPTRLEVD